MATVYEHIREDTGEVFYVGCTMYDEDNYVGDWRPYSNKSRPQKWYEITHHTKWSVNIVVNHIPPKKALEVEKDIIKQYGLENLTNTSKGGQFSIKEPSTECKHGHPFTEENTYITSKGWRRCKICRVRSIQKRTIKNKKTRKLSHLPTTLQTTYIDKELEDIPRNVKFNPPPPTHCKYGHRLDDNQFCVTCAKEASMKGAETNKKRWEKKMEERTHCKRGHEWKEENLVLKKGKYWECRLCHNELKNKKDEMKRKKKTFGSCERT